jgi:hypothetical protein
MDLESGLLVEVQGVSQDVDTSQGEIVVVLVNENSQGEMASINGYDGGVYPSPDRVGPLQLTSVSGSLATGDMLVGFSYEGGTGTFDPQTATFSMSG